MHRLGDIYDDIRLVQEATDNEGVLSVLRNVARSSGYDHFIISGLPLSGRDVEPFVLAADWPKSWYDRYFEKDYAQFDPVVHHCFHTLDAFEWEAAPLDRKEDRYGARVMDEATDCGLSTGLCIPVHAIDGMQGCVSFGGTCSDQSSDLKTGLHVLAMIAHGKLRSLQRRRKINAPRLSTREVEVLKWAADGKTTADISEIMDLSEGMVLLHFGNIAKKLGTLSRTHSVASALRLGVLPL